MNGEWEPDQSKLIQQILQDGAEAEADLFQDKFRKSIEITDIAIQKIPYIEYPGLSKEENKELHLKLIYYVIPRHITSSIRRTTLLS